MIVHIYGLKDPCTGEIRYVGATKQTLAKRLSDHRLERGRYYKCNWVQSLHEAGVEPEIVLLEDTTRDEWQGRERYWIYKLLAEGCRLTNCETYGGIGVPTQDWPRDVDSRKQTSQSMMGNANAKGKRKVFTPEGLQKIHRPRGPCSPAVREKITQSVNRAMTPEIGELISRRIREELRKKCVSKMKEGQKL